ncbi:glycosyltransferase [Halopseudomonas laoshanensis]|uniref:glycosyltransferase n=1 Tax=Halopseudomonas laoshanensis TaxID=2268758 RepID=UPI003736FCBA
MQATVVVSCYKQEKYVKDCLDSILEQKTDFEFDILVSDDCSPDNTPKVLKAYQQNYPDRIRLILRAENVGPAKNYIDAHNQALGDIVFHIDGDDVMLPGKLQEQYNQFRDDPTVNLVFHRANYFSDDLQCNMITGIPYLLRDGILRFDLKDLALWGSITVHSAYAYRRSSRKTRTLQREFMEWFFAMDSLMPDGRAIYLDKVLVKYRLNAGSDAYLSSRSGRIKSYTIYFSDILHYHQISPDLRTRLYANCLFTVLAMYRAKCGLSKTAFLYLLKNLIYFRPNLLVATYKMRNSVRPRKRTDCE